MVLHSPASIALRPRRASSLLAASFVLLAVVGCGHHKRSSLRPVLIGPAPARVVSPACPSGNCGSGGVVPAPMAEPAPLAEPSLSPSPSSSLEQSSFPPADEPVRKSIVTPTTPPRVPRAEPESEPPLELNPAIDAPASAPRGTLSKPPGTSLNSGRRGLLGRPRAASLRERLRPFVNDPEDLFTPPKADRPWKYVVLHHSAHATGSYDEIDREHRKVLGWEGCGYHFVIGNGTGSPDGQVEVAQRWSNQKNGVHCRDGKTSEVNEYGIGICLVGDLDHAPPTPRQIEAAQTLVAYLSDHYTIPRERIDTHAALAASPTACPGKHFPTQAILGARDYAQR